MIVGNTYVQSRMDQRRLAEKDTKIGGKIAVTS
jgi:hypothetical protein